MKSIERHSIRKIIILAVVLFIKVTASGAVVDDITIKSEKLNSTVPVTVINPDIPEGNSTKTIPTLYLLNGYDGNHTTWLSMVPDLPSLADQYGIRIICPHGLNSWYWDSPKQKGMQYESFFIEELIPQLGKRYNLPSRRELTAITGFSMGGHGAFWLATQHPNEFGAIGSISGGLDLRKFKTNWNLPYHLGSYKENERLWYDSTIISQYSKLKSHPFAIVFDCGVDDFFYSVNLSFHQLLLDANIPHDFTSRPGAHTQAYAANSLSYQLLYFSKFFKESRRNQ